MLLWDARVESRKKPGFPVSTFVLTTLVAPLVGTFVRTFVLTFAYEP